jgi:hypothetical protein
MNYHRRQKALHDHDEVDTDSSEPLQKPRPNHPPRSNKHQTMTPHAVSTTPTSSVQSPHTTSRSRHAEQQRQQKIDRIVQDDHIERGGRSRPASVPDSPSKFLSLVEPRFTAVNSTGIPAYPPYEGPEHESPERESLQVKRRGAPKRKHSTESLEQNSKRRSHAQEVLHPVSPLIVKLKLTRNKTSQARQSQISKPQNPLPVDSMHMHHETRYNSRPLVTDEAENMPMACSPYNDCLPQSDRPSDPSANVTLANAVNGDRSPRKQTSTTVQDTANRPTRTAGEAVSKASEAVRVVGLGRTGQGGHQLTNPI